MSSYLIWLLIWLVSLWVVISVQQRMRAQTHNRQTRTSGLP